MGVKPDRYEASVWDHEGQRWERRYQGVAKWGLRQVIQELRDEGWSFVSVLIQKEPSNEERRLWV